MNKLEKARLKQLNHIMRAIENLEKAFQVGEKNEQLGYNNGALATLSFEASNIYTKQVDVEFEDTYDGPGVVA